MNIYIVRHGQTENNVAKVHQTIDTPLSATGYDQAELLGRRCRELHFDRIWSSPYHRTLETAIPISIASGKNVEPIEELREFRKPSEIQGKSHDDPEAVRIKNLIKSHADDQKWHFSDEENFFDLKIRLVKLQDRILNSGDDKGNLILVTHKRICVMFLALVIHGHDLTREQFDDFYSHSTHDNVGISLFTYAPTKGWQLKIWNDNAHLAEFS